LRERPLVRPRRSEEDNKRILKIEYEGVNWIYLAQDTDEKSTLVSTVINFRIA
jgi:hypothetical protein